MQKYGVPLFVIAGEAKSSGRDIHLGWVKDSSDKDKQFLIAFSDAPPDAAVHEEEHPFELCPPPPGRTAQREDRVGQTEFRFYVFKCYGAVCAVCDMKQREVLEAAHIVPHSQKGPFDARNGLVLCATHHRAQEHGLFGIHPHTTKLHFSPGVTSEDLEITKDDLTHIPARPATEALEWKWNADNFDKSGG